MNQEKLKTELEFNNKGELKSTFYIEVGLMFDKDVLRTRLE